jgi:hypothetical protein
MGLKGVIFGVVLGILLVGCAGLAFPYRHYGMDLPEYEGTLLGPSPKFDLPFSLCKPDDVVKGKCVIMFAEEFYKLKTEYKDMARRLRACRG